MLHFEGRTRRHLVLYVGSSPEDSDLRRLISSDTRPGCDVLGAATLFDAVETLRTQPIDAVVLAVSRLDDRALQSVRAIRSETRQTPIVVLSDLVDESFRGACVAAGAEDCLSTREACTPALWRVVDHEIARAHHDVAPFARALDRRVTRRRGDEHAHDADCAGRAAGLSEAPTSYSQLSRRELEVFRMIALGRSVRQVAETLHLSTKTIATYLHRIGVKTGLTSRVDIARFAIQQGLVD